MQMGCGEYGLNSHLPMPSEPGQNKALRKSADSPVLRSFLHPHILLPILNFPSDFTPTTKMNSMLELNVFALSTTIPSFLQTVLAIVLYIRNFNSVLDCTIKHPQGARRMRVAIRGQIWAGSITSFMGITLLVTLWITHDGTLQKVFWSIAILFSSLFQVC